MRAWNTLKLQQSRKQGGDEAKYTTLKDFRINEVFLKQMGKCDGQELDTHTHTHTHTHACASARMLPMP